MTLKLPQRKVAAIIRQCLQGKPQCTIAEEEVVNRATVSLSWTRFRERSRQVGLSAAGKEFGVYNEVDELRSLSVELEKSGISVTQAREGVKIVQAFTALRLAPQRHTALVKVCRHIDQPGFVEAACQLAEIQERAGITYDEAPLKLKKTVEELRGTQAQLESTRSELGTKRQAVAKANQDLAGVMEQVAAARKNAQDQQASLNQQIQAAMREAGVKQAEIQEVALIKRDLGQHSLKLPALVAVAGEFKQGREVDTVKLGQAIDEFGSLRKANDSLRRDNEGLTKSGVALREDTANLQARKNELLRSLMVTGQKAEEENRHIHELAARRIAFVRQYDLVDGLIAMLTRSPLLPESAECVKKMMETLSTDGWRAISTLDDLRSLFVRTIMGDLLRCFHCDHCGASFIVNKNPHYNVAANYYRCPACRSSSDLKPSDAFLKALASDRQLDNVRLAQELERENGTLRPFKVFLEMPCVICHQPIKEWTEQWARSLMERSEQAHPQCWNTPAGQLWQMEWLMRKTGRL